MKKAGMAENRRVFPLGQEPVASPLGVLVIFFFFFFMPFVQLGYSH